MEQCQYNEILNKIYSIIRKNTRLLKLMYYTNNVNIDDDKKYPPLSKDQTIEVLQNIKKFHSATIINGENKVYITMEHSLVNFSNPRKRNTYLKYWSDILFNVYVSCPTNIEELQGCSRCMEIVSELQKSLSDVDVDAKSKSVLCGFERERVVEGFVSYKLTLRLKDINDGMIGRDVR